MFVNNPTYDDMMKIVDTENEFICVDKGSYKAFDYVISGPTTFDSPLKKEMRGFAFLDNGKVSRPYHKFFNIGEKEETQQHILDWDSKFSVLDKLDGSMIHPYAFGKKHVRLATRKGITDVAMQAEVFLAHHSEKIDWILDVTNSGYTPIFEYVGPNNKIVCNYNHENMILTAIRDNATGKYVDMSDFSSKFDIVGEHEYDDIHKFLEETSKEQDKEGYVIRWENGNMVKSKNEWYRTLHGAFDAIRFDHKIIHLYLANQLDDVICNLPDTEKQRVEHCVFVFDKLFKKWIYRLTHLVKDMYFFTKGDKRTFALNYADMVSKTDKYVVFSVFNGKKINTICNMIVQKNLETAAKYQNLLRIMTE